MVLWRLTLRGLCLVSLLLPTTMPSPHRRSLSNTRGSPAEEGEEKEEGGVGGDFRNLPLNASSSYALTSTLLYTMWRRLKVAERQSKDSFGFNVAFSDDHSKMKNRAARASCPLAGVSALLR